MPEQPPPLVSSGKIGNDNAGSPPKKADDMGRSVAHRLSGTERKEGLYIVSIFPRIPRNSITHL